MREFVVVTLGMVAVTAPWWLLIVTRHGVAPFVSALSGNAAVYPMRVSIANLLTLSLSHETWFPIATMLALLGLATCAGRRDWFLPTWLVLTKLVDARGQSVTLVLPVALLAGVGVLDVLLPVLSQSRTAGKPNHSLRAIGVVVCGLLLCRALTSDLLYAQTQDAPIPTSERTAMAWSAQHTRPGDAFLVYASPASSNADDVEWFPALTGRISLVTAQGQEWVSGEYARRTYEIADLMKCGPELRCVEETLGRYYLHPRYIYLGKPDRHVNCDGLCLSLLRSHHYAMVYGGPGAWIFRVTSRASDELSAAAATELGWMPPGAVASAHGTALIPQQRTSRLRTFGPTGPEQGSVY